MAGAGPVHLLLLWGVVGLLSWPSLLLVEELAELYSSCWGWREIQCTGGGLLHDIGPEPQPVVLVVVTG